jgi:hypothetical protein
MTPDIIISWPRSCDYPLWRQMIRDNRDKFNKVIIVFTQTHYGPDYRSFVAGSMQRDNCFFVDNLPVTGEQDWRNVAVNHGLSFSSSEWVWFTEQDFLPQYGFWEHVAEVEKEFSAIGVMEGSRVHPACLFVKRDIVSQTKKDFSIVPEKADHFYRFTKQIEGITSIGIIPSELWHHMNGLSQNYCMAFNGEVANYNPPEFNKYLLDCQKVSVMQDPRFNAFANAYLNRVKSL